MAADRQADLSLVERNDPQAPAEEAGLDVSVVENNQWARCRPGSRTTRFRVLPAVAPTSRPVAVEPVNEIIRTRGSSQSACPTSAPPGIAWSRPSGSPASSKIRASTTPPETGVLRSGLRITALPSASAGPIERSASTYGKFQGVITPTTPSGTPARGAAASGGQRRQHVTERLPDQGRGQVELPD